MHTKLLLEKPEAKRDLVKTRHRGKDNSEINLTEIGYEYME
jgi:molybdenum-dependent DNA-binding transcriptional regulator ModE